jgi:hypothetical protein
VNASFPGVLGVPVGPSPVVGLGFGGFGSCECVEGGPVVPAGGVEVVVEVTGGSVAVVVVVGGASVVVVTAVVVVVSVGVGRQWFSFPSALFPWASQSWPSSDGSGTQLVPFTWSLHPDPGSFTSVSAWATASIELMVNASMMPKKILSAFFIAWSFAVP